MYTDPITQRIIETKIAQIKGAHPESKVVKQGEGHFADPVVVHLLGVDGVSSQPSQVPFAIQPQLRADHRNDGYVLGFPVGPVQD